MQPAGYSGTPLAKKLGIKAGFKIRLYYQPDYYFKLFDDLPSDISQFKDSRTKKNLVHYFTTSSVKLENDINELREEIEQNGMIWISWPKKASKVATDLNENIIREIALRNGLVDVKVCAIDETWSALKLVIRLKDRQ